MGNFKANIEGIQSMNNIN